MHMHWISLEIFNFLKESNAFPKSSNAPVTVEPAVALTKKGS